MKHWDWAELENAIYKTLSRTEWKRSFDIIREINEGLSEEDEASMAQIYTALERAQLGGWAERRVVVKKVASLGRKPMEWKIAEYKLTGGVRQSKEKKSWLGWLFPKFA